MARKGVAVVAVVVAARVALTACAQPREAASQRFVDHARAVAAAWSTPDQQERWQASLVPVGPLTVEYADGSAESVTTLGARASCR